MPYRLIEAPNFSPLVATHTATYDLYQRHDFIGRMPKLRPELRIRCPYVSQLRTKMAQPVAKAATDQKDFGVHRIVRRFCYRLICWLSGQQNVDRRNHGHQSHIG